MRTGWEAVLLLDGGDLLFRDFSLKGNPEEELLRGRAKLVAQVFHGQGVAAVNVGRRDLAAGLGFAEELGRDPGLPWVSANLRTPDGRYPFPRWRVVPWGSARVGVVGVLPPDPVWDARLGIQVQDPAGALGEALAALAGVDAVICLSNLGVDAERQLALRFPGLLLVVGRLTGQLPSTPIVEGGTLLLHVSDRGRYLGVLDVPRASLGHWRQPLSLRERALLENRLEGLRAQLRGVSAGDRAAELGRQVREAEEGLSAFDAAEAVYDHRVLALDPSVGTDGEVAEWVARHRRGETRPRKAAPARFPILRRVVEGPTHTGTAACRSCHPTQYGFWVGTRHARAMSSLRGQARDPQCLACHATVLERPSGPAAEPVVGCEACHGPGGSHRARGDITRRPAETTCRACHGVQHPDEVFDYDAAYGRIRCDKGGATGGAR